MVTPAPSRRSLEQWLRRLEQLHPKKIDMSLGRVTEVLERLELRPPPYRAITVAGTNGKGSCVAMLESIYWHAGYKVGSFTSPHLWRFNERIRIDGEDAADAELVQLFELIDAARGGVTLSYFESSAVAALVHFARVGVDVAILEVGMGGRLDATNAVDADAALIASIDLDHMEWLGPDREAIGREKAGVFRAGRPAIVADRNPPASVLAHARETGAELVLIGRDFDFVAIGEEWRETPAAAGDAPLPLPPFGGREQYGNAAACAAVVRHMQSQLPVAHGALAAGIRHARLRARFERHTIDGVEWVFDVAHNPAAAQVMQGSLARLPRAGRTLAVFAAMRDKDLSGVLAPFVAEVDAWLVAQADPERGAPPELLAAQLAALGARRVEVLPDVAGAVAAAGAMADPGDRVLTFGSFHTVGAATAALQLYSAASPLGTPPARWTRV